MICSICKVLVMQEFHFICATLKIRKNKQFQPHFTSVLAIEKRRKILPCASASDTCIVSALFNVVKCSHVCVLLSESEKTPSHSTRGEGKKKRMKLNAVKFSPGSARTVKGS